MMKEISCENCASQLSCSENEATDKDRRLCIEKAKAERKRKFANILGARVTE